MIFCVYQIKAFANIFLLDQHFASFSGMLWIKPVAQSIHGKKPSMNSENNRYLHPQLKQKILAIVMYST